MIFHLIGVKKEEKSEKYKENLKKDSFCQKKKLGRKKSYAKIKKLELKKGVVFKASNLQRHKNMVH